MRNRSIVYLLLTLLAGVFAFSATGLAAKPPGAGGGGGGGGNAPPDYGDLFILYRDADGIPILTADSCQQPLAAGPFEGCLYLPDAEQVEENCVLIPVDPATCTVVPQHAIQTQEVDFGRINEVRSPDTVFEAQLEDAMLRLATAGCIGLDPAGRPVYSSLIDGEVVTATIDSPLQNLAMYRQYMLDGSLGDTVSLPADWLDSAARAIGAALDKGGEASMDMLVYMNQILGLTEPEATPFLGKKCIEVREEVMGVVKMVQKCFLDYSSYAYDRGINYATGGALPYPPYIPQDDPTGGWFEFLFEYDPDSHFFMVKADEILSTVFGPDVSGFPMHNIAGFAQAADDTRAVIEYMHTWPVPGEYETPVTCDVGSVDYSDLSISADSGLQVPVRMVAGTEGREGTVTVTNAGPAEASGTVMVIGIDAEGIPVGPLYRIVDGLPTEETIFDEPEEFVLAAGYSSSWSFFFSIDYATRITWTATAQSEQDVNAANNTVTEVTVVTRPKGGGGGGH